MRHLEITLLLVLVALWPIKRGFAQQTIVGSLGGARNVYDRAEEHMMRGEYREAREMVKTALRANPSDFDLHELLGKVYGGMGDFDRSIEAYTQAIRHGSRRYSIYHNRGAIYVLRKDWVHAIADFSKAIRIEPDRPECYYNRANIYFCQHEYTKALADLERAYERGAENPTAYALARLLATCPDAKVRDGRRAVEYAHLACKQAERREYASLSVLAAAHAEAGQWDEAVRCSEQALELAEGEWRRLERTCLELYRLHEPYREFTPEQVVKQRPSTAGEALLYAIVKIDVGNNEGAIADLRESIKMNPRLAKAHFLLGERTLWKDTNEAVRHLSRSLDLDPKHSEAFGWRAIANLWLGKYREALADAEASLRLDPKDPNALSVRPWALASCGEVERVLQDLKGLSQEQANDPRLHALRGHCYLIQGRLSDTVAEITKAIQAYPSDVLAHADRAVTLSALGKADEAKRDLEECVRLAPALRTPTEARMRAAKEKRSHP